MDLDGIVEQIVCPLLVMRGELDRQVPLAHATRIFERAAVAEKTLKILTAGEGARSTARSTIAQSPPTTSPIGSPRACRHRPGPDCSLRNRGMRDDGRQSAARRGCEDDWLTVRFATGVVLESTWLRQG
jgi:fermentation-respiration switch protein FrsA (DUF1100 family)